MATTWTNTGNTAKVQMSSGNTRVSDSSIVIPLPDISLSADSPLRGGIRIGIGCDMNRGGSPVEAADDKKIIISHNDNVLLRTWAYTTSWKQTGYNNAIWKHPSMTIETSSLFNQSNSNEIDTKIKIKLPKNGLFNVVNIGKEKVNISPDTNKELSELIFTLNAPPTFIATVQSSGTYRQNLTPYKVKISSATAKYGGNIVRSELLVGNQSVTGTGNGTLSITPSEDGTFTPTVKVTDSRGQVSMMVLDPITVLPYNVPIITSFDIIRCDNQGVPRDDGSYALLTASFNYSSDVTTLAVPTVKKDGANITSNTTWYESWDSLHGCSNRITFPYSSQSTGTIYALVNGNFITNTSYQVGLTLNDSLSSSSIEITQILPFSFYTIDFKAGGRGIAFGKASTMDGFECDMDAKFNALLSGVNGEFSGDLSSENLLLSLDTTDPPDTTTIDGQIFKALQDLGWDSDVIV